MSPPLVYFRTHIIFDRDANDDDIIEEPANSETSERHSESGHRNLNEPQPPTMTRMNLSLRNLNSLQSEHRPLTNGNVSRANPSTIDVDSDSEHSHQNHSRRMGSSRPQHHQQPQQPQHQQNQQQLPPLQPAHDKFRAFGQFVASSLIDMPEKNALELVERFTREIVQTLIATKSPPPADD